MREASNFKAENKQYPQNEMRSNPLAETIYANRLSSVKGGDSLQGVWRVLRGVLLEAARVGRYWEIGKSLKASCHSFRPPAIQK